MIWGRRRRRIITSAWERAVSHERPFLSAPPQSWYLKFQPALTTQGHKREQSVLHAQPLHTLRSPPPTGERSSPSCIRVCVCVCVCVRGLCAGVPHIRRLSSGRHPTRPARRAQHVFHVQRSVRLRRLRGEIRRPAAASGAGVTPAHRPRCLSVCAATVRG